MNRRRHLPDLRRRVDSLEQLSEPSDLDGYRDPSTMSTGQRRRRIEQIEAEIGAELGIDPADRAAFEEAIEHEAQRDLAQLAGLLGMSADDEAGIYLAAAKRAAALGDRELAARWRRLSATEAGGSALLVPPERGGGDTP